jgi:hypothetical protein
MLKLSEAYYHGNMESRKLRHKSPFTPNITASHRKQRTDLEISKIRHLPEEKLAIYLACWHVSQRMHPALHSVAIHEYHQSIP